VPLPEPSYAATAVATVRDRPGLQKKGIHVRRVALFEFTVFQGIYPLASGYLEAAARADPDLREQYTFEKFSRAVDDPTIPAVVAAVDADIYAFSCYVWNMGLVRRLIRAVRASRPSAYIVLGGPQVMHRAHIYLAAQDDRAFVCNGEGERTFPNLLRQLSLAVPDFRSVRGLSFHENGHLVTTSAEERIRDLNEVPSPYLTNVMDSRQSVWGVLETNRGCPFKCTYCYWGGATNAKVTRYELQRILDEITWFGDNRVLYLFIADANFGMLARDLEIAQHIASTRARTGYPVSVYFSSSKNTPDKVSKIATLLAESGLVSTLPISLQTTSETTLASIKRENIRPESYLQLQGVLNEKKVSSFIELIWPLPGETLQSFCAGIGDLCRMGANSFAIYPLLLIGNVEMEQQTSEYGLVAIEDPDPHSEARIVIQTRDATHAEYLDGIRLAFHVTSLHSVRGLWHVAAYLSEHGGVSFAQLLTRFAQFCTQRRQHPYVKYIEDSIASFTHTKFTAFGGLVHNVLHAFRAEFDELLLEFVRNMGWFENEEIRLRMDIDLLNRPYVYSNTPITASRNMQLLHVTHADSRKRIIDIPLAFKPTVGRILGLGPAPGLLSVGYRSDQIPYMSGKSPQANHSYCDDRLHMIRSILPVWSLQ
jgi:radical SAM superfamily enzyme YgiQ (UPF0313 family)